MIEVILLALVLASEVDVIPIEHLEDKEFGVVDNSFARKARIVGGTAKRENPSTSLTWRVKFGVTAPEIDDRNLSAMMNAWEHQARSMLPIGTDVRFRYYNGSISIASAGPPHYVSLHFLLQGSDAKGFYKAPEHDWTADTKFAEWLAREILARAAGRNLGTVTNRSFGGYSARGATQSGTGRAFVELADWARIKGWSVEANDELNYRTLRKGAHYLVVVRGAAKFKVDGVWRALDDLVAAKDGNDMVVEGNLRNLP